MDRLRVAACAALVLAGCATPQGVRDEPELAARVDAALTRSGAGPDALRLIDNFLGDEAGPPPGAPALVRELLARPLAAADAAGLFRRTVPAELEGFTGGPGAPAGEPLEALIDAYVRELAQARELLLQATAKAPDIAALAGEIDKGDIVPERTLLRLTELDPAQLARANALFLSATARFVRALRAGGPGLRFPEAGRRFESPIGLVVIGTAAADRHGPDAALIIDPGGDDIYERAPTARGGISVIVDLGGNDRYRGSDLALAGFSALVDLAGNDRYEMSSGLGAAVAGAALLVDFAGDDVYEGRFFSQGAAAFGFGALLDLGGNDSYRVLSGGQGYGAAGGVGLLWDRAGNDRYVAEGPPDLYNRGGGISMAQGAAFGARTMLGAGIGILRDDSGDDRYELQMFGQGTAYYYGVGLLWDRAGNDQYKAVRYAQGNGVHEAVGTLRDESGDDSYELSHGVGQGMGLDLSVGVLYEAEGNDRYSARIHAQGSATGNGFGLLADLGGADELRLGDARGWGRAESFRDLPSFGLAIYDATRATFLRDGVRAEPPPAIGAALPAEPPRDARCPPPSTPPPAKPLGLAQALRGLEFMFRDGSGDPALYAYAQRRLIDDLPAALQELPAEDFLVGLTLGDVLQCTLRRASAAEAKALWDGMERALATPAGGDFALAVLRGLRERAAPAEQMQRLLTMLDSHKSCGVRAAALRLRDSPQAAQAALRSSCWRLQAVALEVLARHGVKPDAAAQPPSFLRGAGARS